MSYLDDASLVVIPSGYKPSTVFAVKPTDGTGDLTFTRSNDTATRVGPDGLIEKVRTNLATYSEDFTNAAWTKIYATVTANSVANPLNGATTADTITPTTDVDVHRFRITSTGLSAGQVYTFSFYAKANGYNFVRIIENTTTGDVKQFNLSNGTIDTGTLSGQIVSLGNGWYRCAAQIVAASSQTIDVQIQSMAGTQGAFAGNGTSGVYVFGAQLELSDFGATDYIATTSAAVSVGPVANVPRLDYLNSSCPRLLLEPQRTNLVTYSEQLNTGSGGTTPVTANTAVSPDGYTNADTIGTGYWTKSTSQAAGTYTLSVFAKYQSAASIGLYIYDGAYYQGSFNLQTGVATPASGSPTVSMVSYGNGWYRCILTATTASTISEVGFGSGNFYGYGLQLEAGAYATSYIPTLGAAVTRGADAASKTGISSLIGQTEGAFYCEVDMQNLDKAPQQLLELNQDANNRFGVAAFWDSFASVNRMQLYQFFGGGLEVNIQETITSGVLKVAVAYKANDYVLYINGVQIGTDTSASVPTASILYLGSNGSSFFVGNGVKQVLLFKTRLSNADLAALTA